MQFNTAYVPAKFIDCHGCSKCIPNGGLILRRGSGRCTTAHEYLFLFAKTNKYFWDAAASQEKATSSSGGACFGKISAGELPRRGVEGNGRTITQEENAAIRNGSRNMRSVWTLSSEPTKEKHFATFPSELVRRCLAGGVSHGGVCAECGAPFAPVVEKVDTGKTQKMADGWDTGSGGHGTIHRNGRESGKAGVPVFVNETTGYRPTCQCGAASIGALVLDPFNGIGTTGQTARQLGFRYIGIDLNAKYLEVAKHRIFKPPVWWKRLQPAKTKKREHSKRAMLLF